MNTVEPEICADIIDLTTKDMCHFPILLILLNDYLSTKAGECILSPVCSLSAGTNG